MSSLLQFSGSVDRARGVALQFVKVIKGPLWEEFHGAASREPNPEGTTFAIDDPAEAYTCTTCGRSHARIWIAWRKPVDMFGCWVRFRYNGRLHAPDLSIPISTLRIPRGARQLSPAESSEVWHGK